MGFGEIEPPRLQPLVHDGEHIHQAGGIVSDPPQNGRGSLIRLVPNSPAGLMMLP